MFRLWDILHQYMQRFWGPQLEPPPSPILSEPWRNIRWGDNKEVLHFLQNYQPKKDGVTRLRFLLYGPVGNGKSSFINSVMTVMRGQITNKALVCAANSTKSATNMFNIYEIPKGRGNEKTYFNITLCDTMGMEGQSGQGCHAEDIILSLKGHVKKEYTFNEASPLSSENLYYNSTPNLDEKVHVLVCVLSTNMTEIDAFQLQKMADVRKSASKLGIPQVAILTKVDEACPVTQKNLRDVYNSKHVKKKMKDFSAATGIPMNCIFPVKNYCEENELNDDVNALILNALRLMVQFGDDFIEES